MKSSLLFLIAVVVSANLLFPQQVPKGMIRGRVLDDSTGAPLPLANVFVSNSTVGTAANEEGKFELRGVPIGTQQIVASIVGYKPVSFATQVNDSVVQVIQFRLRARAVQLPGVDIEEKDPVEWRKHLQRFIDAFFGSTPNSERCRILNPQVLDFAYDEDADRLVATAREPLDIENLALGYRFQCVIVLFTHSPPAFQYIGFTTFRPLVPRSVDEADQWKANRRNAYYGSKRHFLQALGKKTTKKEGFDVYSIRRDLMWSALKKPAGFEMNVDGLLSPGDSPYEKKLDFQDLLQVVYTRDNVTRISLLELTGPSMTVFTNGLTANPLGLCSYGFWSTQRGAEMLPIDYEPE
ncbi:MAG: carboxypeptidase-like regulatory domain-containing protein [Bacteroidota bacterium]|jgi:hypothetical protein